MIVESGKVGPCASCSTVIIIKTRGLCRVCYTRERHRGRLHRWPFFGSRECHYCGDSISPTVGKCNRCVQNRQLLHKCPICRTLSFFDSDPKVPCPDCTGRFTRKIAVMIRRGDLPEALEMLEKLVNRVGKCFKAGIRDLESVAVCVEMPQDELVSGLVAARTYGVAGAHRFLGVLNPK